MLKEGQMFGTVYVMRPKNGHEDRVADYYRRWDQERKPRIRGAVAAYVFKPKRRPNELVGVVVFDSEDNYYRNAADPEQNKWYRQLRELLVSDPDWNDGDILVAI
jgi:hypothetical protein